jgi:hypothetical protein
MHRVSVHTGDPAWGIKKRAKRLVLLVLPWFTGYAWSRNDGGLSLPAWLGVTWAPGILVIP